MAIGVATVGLRRLTGIVVLVDSQRRGCVLTSFRSVMPYSIPYKTG